MSFFELKRKFFDNGFPLLIFIVTVFFIINLLERGIISYGFACELIVFYGIASILYIGLWLSGSWSKK